MKKRTKKSIKASVDKLTSLLIRSKGICELKGLDIIRCNGGLQTLHIVGRDNHRLRFDEINLLCGCAGHHMYYTHKTWRWYPFIEEHFPERFKYIKEHENEVKQWKEWELLELELELKQKVVALN